jgi:hypothetical protein
LQCSLGQKSIWLKMSFLIGESSRFAGFFNFPLRNP